MIHTAFAIQFTQAQKTISRHVDTHKHTLTYILTATLKNIWPVWYNAAVSQLILELMNRISTDSNWWMDAKKVLEKWHPAQLKWNALRILVPVNFNPGWGWILSVGLIFKNQRGMGELKSTQILPSADEWRQLKLHLPWDRPPVLTVRCPTMVPSPASHPRFPPVPPDGLCWMQNQEEQGVIITTIHSS